MARVLVVDDEPAIRALIRSTLEPTGHAVLEAADGPSGLEAALSQLPDLVLLDIALPGLSGLEVCRRLKADPATTQTKVLFLTGLPQPEAPPPFGADGCIAKPFTPDDIVRQIEQVLLRGRQPASRR